MKKGGGRGKSRGRRGKVCGCITESQEEENERSYRTLQALFFLTAELYEVLVTQ